MILFNIFCSVVGNSSVNLILVACSVINIQIIVATIKVAAINCTKNCIVRYGLKAHGLERVQINDKNSVESHLPISKGTYIQLSYDITNEILFEF